MIEFKRKGNKYVLKNGVELPVRELLKHSHTIEGDEGVIHLGLKEGDTVIKFPSTLEMDASPYNPRGVIKEFTVFGDILCACFEDSNIPHAVDCLGKN